MMVFVIWIVGTIFCSDRGYPRQRMIPIRSRTNANEETTVDSSQEPVTLGGQNSYHTASRSALMCFLFIVTQCFTRMY